MGGRTGVALLEGKAVAAGGEPTSPTGVSAAVAEMFRGGETVTIVAIDAPELNGSPEELQATASISSAANNVGAQNRCQTGPVRKSVVNGKLLCIEGDTIGRYRSVYGAYQCVASSTSGDLTQNTNAMVARKT